MYRLIRPIFWFDQWQTPLKKKRMNTHFKSLWTTKQTYLFTKWNNLKVCQCHRKNCLTEILSPLWEMNMGWRRMIQKRALSEEVCTQYGGGAVSPATPKNPNYEHARLKAPVAMLDCQIGLYFNANYQSQRILTIYYFELKGKYTFGNYSKQI